MEYLDRTETYAVLIQRYVENARKYIYMAYRFSSRCLAHQVVCGPMYSAVGKDHLEDSDSRKKEWDLAVCEIREMADYAAGNGIKLAFEPLNRFETDMINTVSQGLAFIKDVIEIMLDFIWTRSTCTWKKKAAGCHSPGRR